MTEQELCADFGMAEWFLNALYGRYPEEEIEFRLLRGNSPAIRRTIRADAVGVELGGMEKLNQQGYNVYFGVGTRKNGKVNNIPALWVDIDFKHLTAGLIDHKQGVKLMLLSAEIKPSLIVETGHGIHGYWLTDIGPQDIDKVKDLNKRIARKFGGDHVTDPQRVLRLPGFYNVKDVKKPVFCKVSDLQSCGIIYDVDVLTAWLADVDMPIMGDQLNALVKNGHQGRYQSRSEADFVCVLGLVRAGYDDQEITELYDDAENIVGERYRELGTRGPKYLEVTIDAARRRVENG